MKKKVAAFYMILSLTILLSNPVSAFNKFLSANAGVGNSDFRFIVTVTILFILSIAIAIFISILISQCRKQKDLSAKDEKIKEVKERVERIIGAAPVMFIMTVDSVVIEVNASAKETLGINIDDRLTKLYTDINHSNNIIGKAKREGFIRNEIVRINFPDGTVHRCLINLALTEYDGKTATAIWAIDVEQDEAQKEEIQAARENLQSILDTLPVPASIADAESMKMVYANDSYLKLRGLNSLSDIIGKDVYDILPPRQNDGTDNITLCNRLAKTPDGTVIEMQILSATGEIINVNMRTRQIEYNGKKATMGVMADLTAEKERQQLLVAAATKEKEANQLKSRFLINMSHEVRTPMNAIIGLTEIELRKQLNKETREVYKKINDSAKHLLSIINDVLDLSKIESDEIVLNNEEFELEDTLNSTLVVATLGLDGKSVEVMLNAALDLPRYIIGDKTRLWQILKNFLDNAVKYTEKGKVLMTVYIDKEHSDDKTITIAFIIEDTGIGMSEEQVKKVFAPYERITSDTQQKYSGRGLGTTISKQLCEIMGGKLQVESRLGEGTTIHISMPFTRSENTETEMNIVKSSVLEGIKVLAVDDDKMARDIMYRLLKGTNAECTLAESGMEAIKIIIDKRDKGESFDIILLDYMMEGLNGLETARQIQLALTKAPKLLMVTAYQKLLLKSELEKNSIDDILEKPFLPSQFIRKICQTLGYTKEDTDSKEVESVFMKFKDVYVLLCEDYQLNQEVATGMFSQFGIVSVIAENGKQCMEILNSGKTFDLIFMDLQMPVMDGYETTCAIRANPRFDNIPIISLTADAMQEVADECLKIGMNDNITKPIEFESLIRIFKNWLPENKRVTYAKDRKVETLPQAKNPVVAEIPSGPPKEALARFGGRVELYEKMLVSFAQLLPDKWQDYDTAMQNKEETAREIHKLKGVAGNLSENEIYQGIVEFETSLRSGNPDKELYEKMVKVSELRKKRILNINETNKEPDFEQQDGKEMGTIEEFTILVNHLRDALESYDPVESADIVGILRQKDWTSIKKAELEKVYELTENYEFDDALEALNAI